MLTLRFSVNAVGDDSLYLPPLAFGTTKSDAASLGPRHWLLWLQGVDADDALDIVLVFSLRHQLDLIRYLQFPLFLLYFLSVSLE